MFSYKKWKVEKTARTQHAQACDYVSSIRCGFRFLNKGELCSKVLISRVPINNKWFDFVTYHNEFGRLIGASKIEVNNND